MVNADHANHMVRFVDLVDHPECSASGAPNAFEPVLQPVAGTAWILAEAAGQKFHGCGLDRLRKSLSNCANGRAGEDGERLFEALEVVGADEDRRGATDRFDYSMPRPLPARTLR